MATQTPQTRPEQAHALPEAICLYCGKILTGGYLLGEALRQESSS